MKLKALQNQTFMRDPHPVLEQMRGSGALVKTRIPILGDVWITTTQAAAAQVLKDSDNFTVRRKNGKVVGMQWWMPGMIRRLAVNMLASDEPDHKRLRSLVDEAFHRREIMQLEARAYALAERYADNLATAGNGVDLVQNFARPLPLAVICELLGLPDEDHDRFMRWASAITGVTGPLSILIGMWKLRPLTRYIDERITQARGGESPGLIGELVALSDNGNRLSDDELSAMVFLLLMAGHETTTHLISGGVLALLQHPDQLDKLKSDWSLLDGAVEEMLRYVSPVQSTKPRYVQEACVVEGVQLEAGDVVMPSLVAANHDPAVFDEPERFDIARKPNRHIEFGTGIHFCLGHQLARLEAKAAIKTLFIRFPQLRLAVPENELLWHPRYGIRSLQALPVAGLMQD